MADASLLEQNFDPEVTIVTEASGILLEGVTKRKNIVQFTDVLVRVQKRGLFDDRP